MGHQISFYLSLLDTAELEKKITSLEDTLILHSRSRGPYPSLVDSTDLVENGQRWGFFYFGLQADLDYIVTKEVKTQGYWTIDDKSPVIEFLRCIQDEREIKRGRLYYDELYLDSSKTHFKKKSQGFSEWAKNVFSKVKQALTYDKKLDAYLGDEAIKMRGLGTELTQF